MEWEWTTIHTYTTDDGLRDGVFVRLPGHDDVIVTTAVVDRTVRPDEDDAAARVTALLGDFGVAMATRRHDRTVDFTHRREAYLGNIEKLADGTTVFKICFRDED
jgi:hypothetical protein